MYLIFDTETSGLPKNPRLLAEYVENWPHIVQLSWGLYNDDGSLISMNDFIIRPVGFTIDEDSTKIHGITTEIALREGNMIKDVLYKFKEDWKKVSFVCAHNLDFDLNVIGAEFYRANYRLGSRNIRKKICTMKQTTEYCKIPFSNSKYHSKYKWPRLQELYFKLFNKEFSNAHNAKYDVIACAKCLFHCIENGIITHN